MAFLKNLQDISNSITGTIVSTANTANTFVGAMEHGANAIDKVMMNAEVLADKTLQISSTRAKGELQEELQKLWNKFPELRPEGMPTDDENHHAEEAAVTA